MAVQKYATSTSRNIIRAELEMLKHAENIQVLGNFGTQKSQPLRKTDTIVFRRVLPVGATVESNPADGYSETPSITPANFVTSEGVTPTARTISHTDVSVTLQQYAILFKFTSKAALMYEDDIPGDMTKLTGETLAEVAELVAYGANRAGTAVVYANGTTRAGINSKLSLNTLRKASRALRSNRGMRVTSVIKPGPNFGTSPVEPGYVVFLPTDVLSDARDLPGYTRRVEYGSAVTAMHPQEEGACEEFRFITSPLFTPFLAAGAAVGSTGMLSQGGANVDVYTPIVMAEDAWGHVSLKGNGYTGITPRVIPHDSINHANPSGMFGYVGANFWYACVRLNENHMIRIECGASDLS